ncbi:MAG: hypothetical protein ACIAQU_09335, partial [Phycisphaerales bacterium JB064]
MPTGKMLARLESSLELEHGALAEAVEEHTTPKRVREELAQTREQAEAARQLAALLRGAGPGGL